jgi:basic membrane protein A
MVSLRWSLLAAALACGAAASAARAQEPLKVGFIYIGPASGAGWSYAHELGRQSVQRKYGERIKTVFVEKVPEGASSEAIIRKMADQGASVIFATAIGYMDAVVKTARDYPDVAFEHATGYKTGPNLGIYDIRTYEGACLVGTVAGAMTKTGVLGVVGSLPVPEVIRNINAFTLCAQAVNPGVRTRVVWVSGWYDPPKEHAAAEALIGLGADVLMQNTDSPTTVQVAREHHLYGFGWDTDMAQWGGDAQLAASMLNWGVYYDKVVASRLAGTWRPDNVWLGLKDDAIHFGNFSKVVPERVRQLVARRTADIVSGKRPVFAGPLTDQSGVVRVAAGQEPDDADKLKMNYFVKGIDGKPQD